MEESKLNGAVAEMQEPVVKKRSQFSLVMKRLLKDPLSVACIVVLVLIILIAVFAPQIAPYDYTKQDLSMLTQGPSAEHPLGTDELGRDILSRLIYGSRNSLIIGVASTLIALVIGVPLGLLAGYAGKTTDNIIMRIMDVMQAIPSTLLAISISAALGIGLWNCIAALGIARITGFARMARAASLNVADMEYIEAARAMDMGRWKILFKHVLPNSLSPLIVQGTMFVASAVMVSASLSFIGLGVQPPDAEWGAMLSSGRNYIRSAPHMVLVPLAAILILVLALNLLGDGLRDALDPKLKK